MALKKATKSILLSSGMQNGADDFLLQSPALEYVENGHYDKTGVISKRPGFTALPDNGNSLANDGEPSFLHAIKDNLYSVSNSGVESYDGDSWSTVSLDSQITTSEKILNTIPAQGGSHYDIARYTKIQPGYVAAFEVKRGSADSSTEDKAKDVVVQMFTEEGVLTSSTTLPNARSPKLVNVDGLTPFTAPIVMLFYQEDSTDDVVAQIVSPLTNSITTKFTIATNVYDTAVIFQGTGDTGEYIRRVARVGYSREGHATYQVAASVNGSGTTTFAFYYTNSNKDLVRIITIYDGIGFTQQSSTTLNSGIALSGFFPIAVAIDDTNQQDHLMSVAITSDPVAESCVVSWSYRSLTGTTSLGNFPLSVTTNENTQPTIHGGLVVNGGKVFYAYHQSTKGVIPNRTTNPLHTFAHPKLTFGEVTVSGPSRTTFTLNHHRLTSKPVVIDGEYYAGVQQWIDYSPSFNIDQGTPDFGELGGGSVGDWRFNVAPSYRPVSNVFAKFSRTLSQVTPVAVMSAGQAKHTDASESETNMHIPNTILDGDDVYLSTRVALTSEDILYQGGDGTTRSVSHNGAAPSADDYLFGVELVSAESRADITKITFNQGAQNNANGFGDGIVISGGYSLWFDGQSISELSPIDQPEIVNIEVDGATGIVPLFGYDPFIFAGNDETIYRRTQAVIGFYDRRGNVHRSAPSASVYVLDNSEVTVTVPLSLFAEGRQYFVELYSTDHANPSGIAKLMGHKTFTLDDTSDLDAVTVTSSVQPNFPQIGERSSEALYTTGGVLPSDPWPSFSQAVATSRRFWAVSSENEGTVLYSKIFEEFTAPEFSASLVIPLGDERTLTAINKLDDKVVVFEENDIHVIYGDGPDNTGRGTDFAVHHVSSDVGTSEPKSVVETPLGLVFKAQRGFYLLDRNLQVQFIGDGIRDLSKSITVKAATVVPEFSEIRFIVEDAGSGIAEGGPDADTSIIDRPPRPKFGNELPSNACLVYNYEKQSWSVYSNYLGSASTLYQGKYTRIFPEWDVWQESADRWDDPTGTNRLKLITPWIKMQNVQDFARLYKLSFLGRYLSSLRDLGGGVIEAGDVKVTLRHDYENVDSISTTFKANEHFQLQGRAGGQLRGERMQFGLRPRRQKCQSVQVEIEEVNTEAIDVNEPTYALGRGFEISAIDFTIGTKGGSAKNLGAERNN